MFLIGLAACTPVPTPQTLSTVASPTFQSIPTSTPTLTPIPTPILLSPTTTPVPCDPFTVDFCLSAGHFTLQRPVRPPADDSVDRTYPYGSTANGTRDPHRGVEFVNASGTPVFAAADGMVLFAGPDKVPLYSPWRDFYGNLVVIEHTGELFTLYAHLSKINVAEAQQVFAGDQIGEIGSTGVAIGSHLHFEVRHGDVRNYFSTQNPELWLAPKQDVNGGFLGTLGISIVGQTFDLQYAELTIDYYPDRNRPQARSFYVTTYARELMTGDENAALGDLPPGEYRIAFPHNGRLYERWVEVKSGKLTQVVFIVR